MTNFPTAWQRKVLWGAITTAAIATVSAIVVYVIVLIAQAISFLQPVLIPFVVASVLAFLLDPVVRTLCARTRLPRTAAVVVVFAMIALVLTLLLISVAPQLYRQTTHLAHDLPAYTQKAQQRLLFLVEAAQKKLDQLDRLFPSKAQPSPSPALDTGGYAAPGDGDEIFPDPTPTPAELSASAAADPNAEDTAAASPALSPAPSPGLGFGPSVSSSSPAPSPAADSAAPTPPPDRALDTSAIRDYIQQQLPDIGKQAPMMFRKGWSLLLSSIGGVLGGLGLLFNAIIIPVYLYFLLVESRNIARRWSEYLPLQDSPLKEEIVSVLMEINGYLVAFFRGQLIVSTIDGILIGSALYFFVGLDFAFFIGLLVVVLTFIPYLGIILCYIPAVLIAIIQYGDWQHPLAVVAVMFTVQTLEGFIIAPKIVGDSVGLHPMTVIISIFGWSLLLEGPIGAILAVPLTASLKVLLRRYVWERQERERQRRLVPLAVAQATGHGPTGAQPARETLPAPIIGGAPAAAGSSNAATPAAPAKESLAHVSAALK